MRLTRAEEERPILDECTTRVSHRAHASVHFFSSHGERPHLYRRFAPMESVMAELGGNGLFSARTTTH